MTTNPMPSKHASHMPSHRVLREWLARDRRSERGQTTAEYGLVLLAAATIAMLVVAWAGGTGAITSFFDAIIEKITSLIA